MFLHVKSELRNFATWRGTTISRQVFPRERQTLLQRNNRPDGPGAALSRCSILRARSTPWRTRNTRHQAGANPCERRGCEPGSRACGHRPHAFNECSVGRARERQRSKRHVDCQRGRWCHDQCRTRPQPCKKRAAWCMIAVSRIIPHL